jgi:hypothetical protein
MIGGTLGWWLAPLSLMSAPLVAAVPACRIHAYLADPDPAGTNVRGGPSRAAPVFQRLPHGQRGDPDLAPEVTITGFRDGWAEVSEAIFADYGSGPETRLFSGRGWIAGGLLSATLNRPYIRTRPDARAPIVAHLLGEDWGPDSVLVTAIDDCLGVYAKVTATLPNGAIVRGWTDGLCSNQVTTCP